MVNVPVGVLLYALVPILLGLVAAGLLTGWHRRVREGNVNFSERLRDLRYYVLALVLVLAFNGIVRPGLDDVSQAYGIQFTQTIFSFEGLFVARLQDAVPEVLLTYFSAVYIVGYVVLLTFPPLAYLVLEDDGHVARLLVAYAANYLLGALCYLVFVAHGPRNWLPVQFEQPLYTTIPDVMYITDAVNANTNVFPSLHTSMAVTVLLFAGYTRSEYPRWFLIVGVLAPSVVLATMVLGIHWLSDVLAGVVLAVISVGIARWAVDRLEDEHDPYHRPTDPVRF